MTWQEDPNYRARAEEIARQSMQRIVKELEPSIGLERAESIATLWIGRYTELAGLYNYPRYTASSVIESPIEGLFAVAWAPVGMTASGATMVLVPQAKVGRYRSDFAVYSYTDGMNAVQDGQALFVELDGHNYHERTAEQAEHDRSRDRWFSRNGLHVVRFTGREVWRDPFACVGEVLASYETNVKGS